MPKYTKIIRIGEYDATEQIYEADTVDEVVRLRFCINKEVLPISSSGENNETPLPGDYRGTSLNPDTPLDQTIVDEARRNFKDNFAASLVTPPSWEQYEARQQQWAKEVDEQYKRKKPWVVQRTLAGGEDRYCPFETEKEARDFMKQCTDTCKLGYVGKDGKISYMEPQHKDNPIIKGTGEVSGPYLREPKEEEKLDIRVNKMMATKIAEETEKFAKLYDEQRGGFAVKVMELEKALADEKETRLKYQNLFYQTCNIIDQYKTRGDFGKIVTVESFIGRLQYLLSHHAEKTDSEKLSKTPPPERASWEADLNIGRTD